MQLEVAKDASEGWHHEVHSRLETVHQLRQDPSHPCSGCAQVAAPWEPFEAGHIKRMELVVLARLNWRILALTPASFLDPLLAAAAAASGGADLHRVRGQALSLVCRALPGA